MSKVPVDDVLGFLADPAQYAIVGKTADDFEVVETKGKVAYFDGNMQPMPSRELRIKPEGQRTWKWWKFWTTQQLNLDDMIAAEDGTQYRVMKQADWSKIGGYLEFDITEGPQ
jgi:hypothetical protein